MTKIAYLSLVFLIIPLSGASNPSKYEITVLATNIANFGGFGEWSFGALYEGADETVMFDTGFHEDTVMHNAKRLGKDLSKVEKVVLSHFHADHTGGLLKLRREFGQINKRAFSKVYVARGFFDQRLNSKAEIDSANRLGPGGFERVSTFRSEAEALGITFVVVEGPMEIAENLFITGPVARQNEHYNGPSGLFVQIDGSLTPDIIRDDQSLGMLTEKGWVMMSGCGHAGIINTGETLRRIKDRPIYAAIGGFHLWLAEDEVVNRTAEWLGEAGLEKFLGGHCTGIHATNQISELLGLERHEISHTAVGSVLTRDLNIIRSSVE